MKMRCTHYTESPVGTCILRGCYAARLFSLQRQRLSAAYRPPSSTALYLLRGRHALYSGEFLPAQKRPPVGRASEFVVLPDPAEEASELAELGVSGIFSVRRFILEDPVLSLGFRITPAGSRRRPYHGC